LSGNTGVVEQPGQADGGEIPDLSSREFWSSTERERDELFHVLRRSKALTYQRPPEMSLLPAQQGYWAIVRHEDVRFVSRNPELFCSGQGVVLDDAPAELYEIVAGFLPTDAPKHTRLRGLVSRAFTPGQVKAIEGQIAEQARRIVDDAVKPGDIEAVTQIAMKLPLWTISDMIGVPDNDRTAMHDAANLLVAVNDEEFVGEHDDPMTVLMGGIVTLHEVAKKLSRDRRENPAEDLMSALVHAEVDGESLTEDEIASFFSMLAVAGNDTTRNTITHGIKAFADNPDQWQLLKSDPGIYLDSAVEELIRWASAVHLFRRTATEDTYIRGQLIRKGERVVMFYGSANRDEEVFDEPWKFDITRKPNEHVGFGGGGPHFCMGAFIARRQLRAIFSELVAKVDRIEAGDLNLVTGNLIHNVRALPCRLHAKGE
jgi:cytochrome P450